jgi:lipopolysaccharide/colanic/teichoic acid biosynthesis glycosyltransferase
MIPNMVHCDCGNRLRQGGGVTTGPGKSGRYAAYKRALEVVLSALLLILFAPLLLSIMALVKLTSRGPALYSQVRVGRDGRLFVIYKVRTMIRDFESLAGGPRWTAEGDPGITPLGHFLRRSHLDELPQLWNILRGDMSLVGPRPERPEFVSKLERAIPRYRDRLSVRPGVTGLAQAQLPPDTNLEGVGRKLACDLYYIQNLDFWLDLRLLVSTALFLMGIPFALSCRLLRVPTQATAQEPSPSAEVGVEAVQMQPEPV